MRQSISEKIKEIVDRIVKEFDPEKIILFGSHARGTARPDSDIDLLVVMPVSGSKREKRIEIRVALHEIAASKDILVATPEDIQKYKDLPGTAIRPALLEGKLLYERAA